MKKNNINKRGFTLIELLAVIVILAIIMLFAIPAVLDTSNKAQIKSFQIMGGRVASLAQQKLAGEKLLNEAKGEGAYSAADIGLNDTGGFKVCIYYKSDDDTDDANLDYDITVYMTNGRFCTPSGGTSSSAITTTDPESTNCPAEYTVGAKSCTAVAETTP